MFLLDVFSIKKTVEHIRQGTFLFLRGKVNYLTCLKEAFVKLVELS